MGALSFGALGVAASVSSRFRLAMLLAAVCTAASAVSAEGAGPGVDPGAARAAVAVPCGSTIVTVSSRDPRDAEDLCRGARAAFEWFRAYGLDTVDPIVLEIVDQLPSEGNPSAVGCFDRVARRAHALAYAVFGSKPSWLGLPIDRDLYASVATHELAHALTACTAATYPLATHASEYIAYVAMFSTMPEGARAAVLDAHPDADFVSEWDITDVAYGLDPVRFGVAAYRHFLRETDPASFLRAILASTALPFRHHC